MTPTLTPTWHANQRWVPAEAYEALEAEVAELRSESQAADASSLSEVCDSLAGTAHEAQARNQRLFERIAKLEAAGDTLAILHLSDCTPQERRRDSEAWAKAKKEAHGT